jgi:hypothetical protein
MIVFNVGDYGGNWQAALADAPAANGVLEFPEDCIRLDPGASHTAIRRGLYGAGFVIRDNGNATYFDMVRVLDIAALAGTSSSRHGTLDVKKAQSHSFTLRRLGSAVGVSSRPADY